MLRFESTNIGKVIKLHSRVAPFIDEEDSSNSAIYYDLCNPDWDIVRMTRDGWSIEHNYPQILFKRYPINSAQVLPNKDYSKDRNHLEEFIKLTNVYNDHDNRLLAEVYLISLFLLEDVPKPVMAPYGQPGVAKSTLHEFCKLLVDPSAALTTAFPNSILELFQAFDHSYLTFFDNVSEISDLTSDTICRVVTGGGVTKRVHYTNDEDFVYNMVRAIGLNGINIAATRGDLLERLLPLHLTPIDKRQRRKIKDLRKKFNAMLPDLLGYIFDIVVKVLGRIGEVKLEELPRMADFAEMAELIARCLGYKDGEFTEVYNRNIGLSNQEAIDASPVGTVITVLMEEQAIWKGKTDQLRVDLNTMVSKREDLKGFMNSKGWPRTPRAMRSRLNEVAANLKEIGIVVHFERNEHTKADTIILVNNNYKVGPAPPSHSGRQETKFWEVFDRLVSEESKSQDNHMSDDMDTIGHDKLHGTLMSSSFFLDQEAAKIIEQMVKSNKLKIVATGTYRKVEGKL